ncbi:hypothetical protein IGK89_002419 [Enterococcus sp. DIV0007]|nr:hypothetical protein EA89_02534 [Enterococcus faecium]
MKSDDWIEHTWLPLKRNSKRKKFWVLQLWPLGKLCSYGARLILDLTVYVMIPLQAEEESTNNIQNYISYLIDLQEQFNPGLDMIGFVPYLVDTDSATIKSNLEELYKQHKEDNLVFQNIIKRSNKVSTWSKNGITEHKGYDKKVLSMYKNVFFEMLERIIQLENEKE